MLWDDRHLMTIRFSGLANADGGVLNRRCGRIDRDPPVSLGDFLMATLLLRGGSISIFDYRCGAGTGRQAVRRAA